MTVSSSSRQTEPECACSGKLASLRDEIAGLRAEIGRLADLVASQMRLAPADSANSALVPAATQPVHTDTDQLARDRVALYRSLFAGRDDVYEIGRAHV